MELLNPSTPEKVLKLGKILGMKEGTRVIDFGSGCAEPLALWGREYGITGVGVDISADFCERAAKKLRDQELSDRIEIVCCKGTDYPLQERAFDVATCIGATFVFGGYRETVRALKKAVRLKGRLGIGEVHWLSDNVPPEYAQRETSAHAETELLQMTREEGFELEYVIRASHDDWDRYSSDNWYGLLRWLEENPAHPDRQQVFEHFRRSQDDYFRYERQYMGWATYALAPGQQADRERK
jgi:cyclopropane fatty-acyl-phospholipid synthase-like methyltransferase